MELGSMDFDREAYPHGGNRFTVVTESSDAPDDLSATVRTVLTRDRKLDDRNTLNVSFGCGCWNAPDPRTEGARARIAHWEACPGFSDQVNGFRSHPVHAKWQQASVAFAFKTGDVLPKYAARPVVPSIESMAKVVDATRPGVLVSNVHTFTGVGTDVYDAPETLPSARAPMTAHANVQGVRAVTYLGPPTTKLRDAITAYMASSNGDALRVDAQRLGCILVYGYAGAPVPERRPDLNERIGELEARLAELEGRSRSRAVLTVGEDSDLKL